jgi:Flp pilus assembly pilin Flp
MNFIQFRQNLMQFIRKFKRETGQGLTEYAIILSVISVAAIITTTLFGGAIKSKISALTGAIAGQQQEDIKNTEEKAFQRAREAKKDADQNNGMELGDKAFKEGDKGGEGGQGRSGSRPR